MGTAVTVEIRDPVVPAPALERAFAQLRWVDRMFSTYDEDSQISRINAGVLDVREAHPLVREVLTQCDALRAATHGYFDVRAPLPGAIDPSGLVKGWAVDLAFAGLQRAGVRALCIEAGGDLRVTGGPWRIGIRHPRQPEHVAAVVVLSSGAVATSGAYERGDHIIDPHTRPAAHGDAERDRHRPHARAGRRARDLGVRDGAAGPGVVGSDDHDDHPRRRAGPADPLLRAPARGVTGAV